ncbi:MAG TPA: glycolate oxidase subunit GlcF [Alphaproteobacteria bacterium]|nr:glycolate oxidase subunit GlcF [Alphaproteobacteria bacterium]
MQTNFTLAQLADSDIREADKILRACVHCGFCTATCPTYVLLGDELDSPRGRIYLIKEMLEHGRAATERTVKHVDRCLSCLACMTTCPSGVHYMHLVDHARAHIEKTYVRPFADRALRALLAYVLPRPALFRLALVGARLVRPLADLLPGRLAAMVRMAPRHVQPPSAADRPQIFPAQGPPRKRVALLTGCAQQVLAPHINEATIRLLTRHGCEVAVAPEAGCCGALTHHMGKTDAAHAAAQANIAAWSALWDGRGPEAVAINASGCGTTVKEYGFMFRDDPDWAAQAKRIADMTRDVSELMTELGLDPPRRHESSGLAVAYHAACSLQHGQKITDAPKELLTAAGFAVREPAEAHLCCGSAGTYNLLQPALAGRLKARKIANLARTDATVIAAGNIGCINQLADGMTIPVVHTVELLDWATGGPPPPSMGDRRTD